MKYIGFLKKHDPNFKFSKEFHEGIIVNDEIIKRVLLHLNDGIIVWDWMEYWFDDDKEPIGSATYYSDGEWIWPGYFQFYLKKYNIPIPEDFLAHCTNENHFSIDESRFKDLINEFGKVYLES